MHRHVWFALGGSRALRLHFSFSSSFFCWLFGGVFCALMVSAWLCQLSHKMYEINAKILHSFTHIRWFFTFCLVRFSSTTIRKYELKLNEWMKFNCCFVMHSWHICFCKRQPNQHQNPYAIDVILISHRYFGTHNLIRCRLSNGRCQLQCMFYYTVKLVLYQYHPCSICLPLSRPSLHPHPSIFLFDWLGLREKKKCYFAKLNIYFFYHSKMPWMRSMRSCFSKPIRCI